MYKKPAKRSQVEYKRCEAKDKSQFSKVNNFLILCLFIIVYTQQTLILKIQYKPSAFTGGVLRGNILFSVVGICSLVGNSALGLFKGMLNRRINKDILWSYIAMMVHQVLFFVLTIGIYSQSGTPELLIGKFIIPLLSNLSLGTIFLSSCDSLMDNLATKIIGASSFATAQLYGQKIFGKFLFSFMTDNFQMWDQEICGCLLLSTSVVIGIYAYLMTRIERVVDLSPNPRKTKLSTRKSSVSKQNSPLPKPKEKRVSWKMSYFLFPVLYRVITEAFFLDTMNSSARYIFRELKSPVTGESFINESSIMFVEISTSFAALLIFSKFFSDKASFGVQWEQWSTIHCLSFVTRLVIFMCLLWAMPIVRNSVDNSDIAYVAKIREWEILANGTKVKTENFYSVVMEKPNLAFWLGIGIFVSNSAIDVISAGVLIILMRKFSEIRQKSGRKFSYADIDGLLRVFVYLPAAIPWIKHSPSLSIYATGGIFPIQFTMVIALFIYTLVSFWDDWKFRQIFGGGFGETIKKNS